MKKRVLICDDDTDILFICSYIFEKQGCEVHTRTHCNNIVEMVKEDLTLSKILTRNATSNSRMICVLLLTENRSLRI